MVEPGTTGSRLLGAGFATDPRARGAFDFTTLASDDGARMQARPTIRVPSDLIPAMSEALTCTAGKALDVAGVGAGDLAVVAGLWMSTAMTRLQAAALGVEVGVVVDLHRMCGNIGACSPLASLVHAALGGRLHAGDAVPLATAGPEACAGTVVLRWGDTAVTTNSPMADVGGHR
ncbi:MAG: 3-oxoacyl-[acyl-carrier-protein] synthase III C-terminal domain-containing protein [Acidimicrobiales bacterium]